MRSTTAPRGSSRWWRRTLYGIVPAAVALALVPAAVSAQEDPVSEPWDCPSEAILFQNAPTDAYLIDLVTGESETAGTDIYPHNINATGYNVFDDHVWGYVWSDDAADRQIVRVGSNGVVEEMGNPPGLSAANRNGGDVDDNGHMWLSSGFNWWQVDVDPLSPNYLTLIDSGPIEGGGIDDGWGFWDWAYVPNGQNSLYAGAHRGGENHLFRFDRTTKQMSAVGPLGNLGTAGAVYADGSGFFYMSINGTGEIYRIDVTTATAELFAPGPVTSLNDGAMCLGTQIYLDFGDAPDPNYPTLLGSDGPRHRLMGYDPATSTASLMLGTQVSHETEGQPTAGADGDTHDDGVIGGFVVVPDEPIVVQVVVTNNTGEPATLAGWIDLDGNGAFDPAELQYTTVPPGGGTYQLTFPAGSTTDSTYARFRVFPGEFATASEILPTGGAAAGEVEDYLVPAPSTTPPTTDPADPDPTTTVPGGQDPTTTVPGGQDPTTTVPADPDPTTTVPGGQDPTTTVPGDVPPTSPPGSVPEAVPPVPQPTVPSGLLPSTGANPSWVAMLAVFAALSGAVLVAAQWRPRHAAARASSPDSESR